MGHPYPQGTRMTVITIEIICAHKGIDMAFLHSSHIHKIIEAGSQLM